MIRRENHCCKCATSNYPCMGNACPLREVIVYYCDVCTCECNECYEIDGEHYCEECVAQYLKETFDDLALWEQAEVLNVDMRKVE